MFNLNDYQMHQLNEAHREDVLRQVQAARLAQASSSSARAAALSRLGSTLVTLGTRLQAAAEQEPTQQTAYR
jgi:hypothetical protein